MGVDRLYGYGYGFRVPQEVLEGQEDPGEFMDELVGGRPLTYLEAGNHWTGIPEPAFAVVARSQFDEWHESDQGGFRSVGEVIPDISDEEWDALAEVHRLLVPDADPRFELLIGTLIY